MAEIRFAVPHKLNELILKFIDELGVDKSDYTKSLVLDDMDERGLK